MHKYTYISILLVLLFTFYLRLKSDTGFVERFENGDMVNINGAITSQPYQKGSKQFIQINAFQLQVDAYPRYRYGDYLQVSGTIKKQVINKKIPKLILINPSIQIIEQGNKSRVGVHVPLFRTFFNFRIKLVQKINSLLPEPQASLLLGIVLGIKRELPQRFYEALQKTGTLHVVVASGYNVSVVAGVIASTVLLFMKRRYAIPFVIGGIAVYSVMAGGEPPIIRAAVMGCMAFLAQLLGKEYYGLWALLVTSVLMVVVSPFLLLNVGFQLSVAATFGILVMAPMISRFLMRRVRFLGRWVGEELAVTLGAQLMVLPILLVHFKRVSWISPLVNLLVVNLIPMIMGMGGVLMLVSSVSMMLAQIVAWMVWIPLSAFIMIIDWFNKLSFGSYEVADVSWWWVLGYYFFLWIIFARLSFKKDKK